MSTHVQVLLERGANRFAEGSRGETVLGFVLERGNDTEIREWMDLLGHGAPLPSDLLIRTIVKNISANSTMIELLFDNSLVEHRELHRLDAKRDRLYSYGLYSYDLYIYAQLWSI